MFHDAIRSSFTSSYTPLAIAFILTSLFYGIVQPCKKKYMNNIESVLYCMAGIILMISSSTHIHLERSSTTGDIFFFNLSLVIIMIPSLFLFCYLVIFKALKLDCLKVKLFRNTNSSPDVLPDRLVNPLNYTPLT